VSVSGSHIAVAVAAFSSRFGLEAAEFHSIPTGTVSVSFAQKMGDNAVSGPTEEDKIIARKARFGLKTEVDKKKERALRFDMYHPDVENERKAQRAKRFAGAGATVTPCSTGVNVSDLTEEARKAYRAKRFASSNGIDDFNKLKRRAERFGITMYE